MSNNTSILFRMPFSFQNRYWVLVPVDSHALSKEFKLYGVALTESGQELSKIVELEPMEEFASDLMNFFRGKKLQMTEVDSSQAQIVNNLT